MMVLKLVTKYVALCKKEKITYSFMMVFFIKKKTVIENSTSITIFYKIIVEYGVFYDDCPETVIFCNFFKIFILFYNQPNL